MKQQNTENIKYPKYVKYAVALAVFIFGVAIFYGNTLQNGFIHDDHGQVEENIYIQSLKYAPKVVTGCIWESATGGCHEGSYYRPMHSLSYLITYQISENPRFFHFVNLVYFIINVFLVFILLMILTKNFAIAFLSGIIFLIHPLNTEVVNWIAAVPELLYTMFSLLAIIFYFLYRSKENSKYLVLVCLFYFLGILSKEPAVFTLFVFLALDIIYFKKKLPEMFYWKNMKPYIYCFGFFAIFIILRILVMGGVGSNPERAQMPLQHIHSFVELFASYIAKVFYPHPLNFFYTFNHSYNFFSLKFLISALITALFFWLSYISFKKKWSLLFLFLVWFFAFLFPSLVFVSFAGENIFSERYAFASTIAFSAIISIFLFHLYSFRLNKLFFYFYSSKFGKLLHLHAGGWTQRILEKIGDMKIGKFAFFIIMGTAIILSFSIVYNRNLLWKDDLTLYSDTLKKSPDADLTRYNLALLYYDLGEVELAKKEYNYIINRGNWIGLYRVYNNLGDIYRLEENRDKAIEYFEKSLEENPFHERAYNNIGMIYFEEGDVLKSLTYLCRAVIIDLEFETAMINYNNAVTAIKNVDDKDLNFLYNNLVSQDVFSASSGGNIIFIRKDCSSSEECKIAFSGKFSHGEVLFPFLLLGKTENNKIIRPISTSFDPETNVITISVSKKFKDVDVDFILPSCNGVYYEMKVGKEG